MPMFGHAGILITGAARIGKSSLALQLLERGALLVSDDQTLIKPGLQGLTATAPAGLRGLIEIDGYGIIQLPEEKTAPTAQLALYVALMPHDQSIERLPEQTTQQVLSVPLRRLALYAHDPAAAAKIFAALTYRLLDYTNV